MKKTMDRDLRTLDAITKEDLKKLKTKCICVVGVGGLGGYAVEMLARLNVGTIKVVDDDVFELTNLNRQILSGEHNLGQSKADEALKRVALINSQLDAYAVREKLDSKNAVEILNGADIVLDCVDNIETRFAMQDACNRLGIPLIHGAVGAWQGQVSAIFPGNETYSMIYSKEYAQEVTPIGTTSFLPAMVASYQVSECVKVLLKKGEITENRIMYFDLLNNQTYVVDLQEDMLEEVCTKQIK